ncbi:MAG: AMIN domain-containing protein [Acidobacteriia bacterium]|nr:AMIN domain-containing protein [Terriglobia bacterium]
MKRLIYLWGLLVLLASLSVSASDVKPGEVRKVEVFPAGGEVRVEITLSAPIAASVETAQHPDRLVVKLPGTTSDVRQKRVPVGQYGVQRVRFGLHDPNPPETDLVVDLDEEHPYKMTTEGSKIILLIQPSMRAEARQRNAPAGAASRPLINPLGRGNTGETTGTLNSQMDAEGNLLTPPSSGPPIQFPQANSEDSSSAANARALSEPPSGNHPNRGSLQEGTVFPGTGYPGTGQVPPTQGAAQPGGLDTQSSANAKVGQASAQKQPFPQEPKLPTNASPEPAASVRQDTVSSLPPASGQNVAEKSEKTVVTAPEPVAPVVATVEPSPAPAIPQTTARPISGLAAPTPVPPPPTLQTNVAAITPAPAMPAPTPTAPAETAAVQPAPEPAVAESAPAPAASETVVAEATPEPTVAEPTPAEKASAEGSAAGRVQLMLRQGENPDFRTAFRVKYVAQDSAYLDGGRSVGLIEGMKLVVRDLPNAGGVAAAGANSAAAGDVAELEVLSVAENSAVTEIHSPSRPVKVGDLAYLSSADQQALVEKNALSATRKYPAVVSFTENDTLDEEARAALPRPPSPAVNRSRGMIGTNYIGVLDHGPSNMYTNELGMVLRVDFTRIGGTYWNAQGYWNGRLDHTTNTGPTTLQDTINRTYTLYTSYDNPNSAWVAGFGRMYLPWATSLDTLDGGYAGRKLKQGVTSGIFYGSTPDPTSFSYAPNREMGGGFINFSGGTFDDLHYSSTTGGGMQMLSWVSDRPFLFFENSIQYKRVFSIYQAAQIDSHATHIYQCPPSELAMSQCVGQVQTGPNSFTGGTYTQPGVNWGLGRSFTTVRYAPFPRIEFTVNNTYYRDLPFISPQNITNGALAAGLFNQFLSQGTMGGVRVEVLKQIWVNADLGLSSYSGEKKASLNQMFGVTFGHLPWIKMQADARYSRFNSAFGTGHYEALSLTRSLSEGLQLQILAGQQNFQSSLTSADQSRFLNGMLQTNLGKHYFMQMGGTVSRGNQMNYDQWIFTFGYRFDNRQGQKAK